MKKYILPISTTACQKYRSPKRYKSLLSKSLHLVIFTTFAIQKVWRLYTKSLHFFKNTKFQIVKLRIGNHYISSFSSHLLYRSLKTVKLRHFFKNTTFQIFKLRSDNHVISSFHYICYTWSLKTTFLQNHYISNLQTHNPKSLHLAIFTTISFKESIKTLSKITTLAPNHYISNLQT